MVTLWCNDERARPMYPSPVRLLADESNNVAADLRSAVGGSTGGLVVGTRAIK
jgi:hypothetical protein